MDNNELQNPNPIIFKPNKFDNFNQQRLAEEMEADIYDPVDQYEIFDIIKTINDPEHPLTLEQLNIVSPKNIIINTDKNNIKVYFTPTIPSCSMSTLIGLMIKVKLLNSVSNKYKVDVYVEPGKHYTEEAINRQLNDKERVYAALESEHLKKMVYKGIQNDEEVNEILG
jgi:metal-sulfur cluster biosynthetic enzyme